MAYDALAESVALIESRSLTPVFRLSRRRRFAAMAVDVDGDVAATMFLRRGAGRVHEEIHILTLRGSTWRLLGGGGAAVSLDDGDALLAERPSALPQAQLSASDTLRGISRKVMTPGASGGVLDDDGRSGRLPWQGRWIGYTTVQVRRRVERVQVDDRTIPVPWHGQVLIVRRGHRSARIVAYDAEARALGKARLPSVRRY
ncbi:hypothetical protein [Tomitella fengzijianii]|uniref:Uncharacterized protein n=1 Tax=Tomitella fengzijianii TaxID=2597660 RepID=A0A516X599_9ACTN|nr:hypothetical protein [Tomitella fengzijianii]QDQ97841.1 hypothetical protein FO059_11585 [Tomitella fengzijianii]